MSGQTVSWQPVPGQPVNRAEQRADQILLWAHDRAGPGADAVRNALIARLIAALELKP